MNEGANGEVDPEAAAAAVEEEVDAVVAVVVVDRPSTMACPAVGTDSARQDLQLHMTEVNATEATATN